MWSLLWHRPFSDFLNFRTATSFEFGNGKDALQPKTISTKWYGNIPDSPDWVPGNVWKRNIRWFWDLDHHGEIASRKKFPTLRTGLTRIQLRERLTLNSNQRPKRVPGTRSAQKQKQSARRRRRFFGLFGHKTAQSRPEGVSCSECVQS